MNDNNGWIKWKGGEMPVERGTLVDVKYRSGEKTIGVTAGIGSLENGFIRKYGAIKSAVNWDIDNVSCDIVAYRLHQQEEPEEREEPADKTIDNLLHAWQKAKANADTSRNILKLVEQDETAARKALDDALRAAGYDKVCDGVPKEETLNITDWRDLKPGDIVWWSSRRDNKAGEYTVTFVEHADYTLPLQVCVGSDIDNPLAWIAATVEQWRLIHRPA